MSRDGTLTNIWLSYHLSATATATGAVAATAPSAFSLTVNIAVANHEKQTEDDGEEYDALEIHFLLIL